MSGFDDIINNLNKWIPRAGETVVVGPDVEDMPRDDFPHTRQGIQPPARPEPPRFNVGDWVVIRETRWPPETGKVNQRTGLYSEPGYPQLGDMAHVQHKDDLEEIGFNMALHSRLQDHLTGVVQIGELCRIQAIWCHEDGKTYYFLDNGKRNGNGWTRCSFRFRHATEDEKRQH